MLIKLILKMFFLLLLSDIWNNHYASVWGDIMPGYIVSHSSMYWSHASHTYFSQCLSHPRRLWPVASWSTCPWLHPGPRMSCVVMIMTRLVTNDSTDLLVPASSIWTLRSSLLWSGLVKCSLTTNPSSFLSTMSRILWGIMKWCHIGISSSLKPVSFCPRFLQFRR